MSAHTSKPVYDVAISGYACRLPQASSPTEFWNVLQDRRCVITETNEDRWAKARYLHRDKNALGRSYTFAAGQVEDIWDFDPGFFGVSPREAMQMDPQQRLLLTTVWEAVEHAGLTPDELSGGRTGVYVGASASDHSFMFLGDPASLELPVHDGEHAFYRFQPDFLSARPQGAELYCGYGLFLFLLCDASGGAGAEDGGN